MLINIMDAMSTAPSRCNRHGGKGYQLADGMPNLYPDIIYMVPPHEFTWALERICGSYGILLFQLSARFS
ncbi:hypothetical protein GC093_33455 [Paenibacillus sp. LMG 31456]|uniref:Uncharacterized protein n=1 Tax=Paenibacillus foliorum TaxID=2654974 RepID=A0A972H282_9BACL|nr:hypothetical protein [Paenibacillus foliorum]NOU98102.1 hypothetical protein [Paenibacillus foliorum]